MKPITAKEYLDLKNNHQQVLLLDVREFHEVEEKRIAGSLHVPLKDLSNHIFALQGQDALVVHCRSGARAKEAAQYLEQQGLKNVHYLTTFIDEWEKEGLKVQQGKKKTFSLENLILLYIGAIIFFSILLSFYHNYWLIVPLFVSLLLMINSLLKRSIFQYFKRNK